MVAPTIEPPIIDGPTITDTSAARRRPVRGSVRDAPWRRGSFSRASNQDFRFDSILGIGSGKLGVFPGQTGLTDVRQSVSISPIEDPA